MAKTLLVLEEFEVSTSIPAGSVDEASVETILNQELLPRGELAIVTIAICSIGQWFGRRVSTEGFDSTSSKDYLVR
jgi:hypothetical protein